MKSYLHCAGYTDVHFNQCLFGNFFCAATGKRLCVMENLLTPYLMGFDHSCHRSLPSECPCDSSVTKGRPEVTGQNSFFYIAFRPQRVKATLALVINHFLLRLGSSFYVIVFLDLSRLIF